MGVTPEYNFNPASGVSPWIATLQFDLEAADASNHPDWPLKLAQWSGIIVTNYLHRPLMDTLLQSLAPGGVLIYETFAAGNGQFGKPSNPDFLLAPAELLGIVGRDRGLRVIAYEDGYISEPKPAMIQRICACRTDAHVKPELLAL